ncbi:MAG: ABC transporter permease subunit [Saprospiraceae bacterium]|nr:ABC transporter permease subunit [Saprospiraceae bacterium]MBP7699808.1 ABC transporter permease subunit [Saprospiraceae bacterium]
MGRIIKFVLLNILRNKIVIAYTLILAMLAWSVFLLEDSTSKGVISMLNSMLLIVPLVSIIFSNIYIYNSAEFIELMVSQPVKRSKIWISLFIGLALALSGAFLVGAGIPILLYVTEISGLMLVIGGILLTVIFIALAMLCGVLSRDKAKGIGISIMMWLFFSLLFDGILLFFMFQFSEYSIEKILLGFILFNPVDLARILVLLQLDISALLGYTGAIFKEFLGSKTGILISIVSLCLWCIVPFAWSLLQFNKKDL